MNMSMQGHEYAPFRLRPNRQLGEKLMRSLGAEVRPDRVPPTYLIFLRGERLGVDLFKDLDIPRVKALHAGQRYEWFAPVAWDDEIDVTARIVSITEKQGKRGPIWFADVSFEYRRVRDGVVAVKEVTRLVKQS